jgi:hypothetical protein
MPVKENRVTELVMITVLQAICCVVAIVLSVASMHYNGTQGVSDCYKMSCSISFRMKSKKLNQEKKKKKEGGNIEIRHFRERKQQME